MGDLMSSGFHAARNVLVAVFLGLVSVFAVPSPSAAEFETPQLAPWGLKTKGEISSLGNWDALGWALAQTGDHIYAGGNFLEVTNGARTESQPYLARFETSTGEFDPSFRPTIGGAIYALAPSPDGGLFVGGDLKSWNGQSIGALAKIDPATGARWPGFETRIYGGTSSVRDIKVESDGWVYASGTFTTAGLNGNTVAVDNVVRFNPTSGVIDTNWLPQLNGPVDGVSRSKTSAVTYISGGFTTVNGSADTPGFVGLDDNGTIAFNRPIESLNRQLISCPDRLGPEYCSRMYDVEATPQGYVWITGIEHATYQISEVTGQIKNAHFTVRGPVCWGLNAAERQGIPECRSGGGDGQDLYTVGDRVYATCHCFGGVFSSTDPTDLYIPTTGWANTPIIADGYVKPVSGVIAFDANTGNVDSNFDPYMAGTSGGWGVLDSGDGCLWMTGDFSQVGQPGVEQTKPGRDLVRLCDGGIAPELAVVEAPASCSVSVVGVDATVSWDSVDGADGYRVYRSVDGGSEFWQGRVVAGVSSFDSVLRAGKSHQYLVAAVKPDGSSTDRTLCGAPVTDSPVVGVVAPASCSVSVVGVDATVSWDSVDGADGYRVYRSVDGGSEFWQGRVVAGVSSFDSVLRAGKSHQYLVAAVKPDGSSTDRTLCGAPVVAN